MGRFEPDYPANRPAREECCPAPKTVAFLRFEILKTPLASFLASMTRFFLRSRQIFAVSIFFLLAVVVSLSSATRQPCLHVCSGAWRVSKAGRMTKPETQEVCNQRVAAEARTPAAALEITLPPILRRPFGLMKTFRRQSPSWRKPAASVLHPFSSSSALFPDFARAPR